MAHLPAKGRVSVTIEAHVVGEKFEYYENNYYRPIKVDRIVGVPPANEEGKTKELKELVNRELKKGDCVLAQPFSSYLSPGAEFVLMEEKGKYELLLSGVFTPDDQNAYGDFGVTGLKIVKKLSGPKRAWNYLKEL